ncbi:hypothetical protein BURPS406E_0433 [Burkholderia pseudomallei 406e]|uniref:Uncharacterized protein n=2 Tax=pseudomallei group TaxID=111527 RepID=A2RZH2_BURM9|nr:hypothetical protein BMASAVP1_1001 [Burkholderia mallei SAVP1]ABN00199.2 hypothetical protein BMA10229_1289 [Burkholderia mallei NCTC 10229]ABN88264.1 hypothetical protein BURPS668_A3160 [Burkholderia pseudomallei 668]ABN94279.1 hypothetical protein BURPS1106A_A3031 [Burkholderia pseudomallei 1106a]ABO02919.1 hypothetical protein BMA10247_A2265 [Burkholderia mallei NCTC 10247]AFR20904.1 hypothetical protein BPC006_II2981 [Burkholderia pseudomallei BPC006]EBA46811.1 hypothetical protein BUR
MSSYKIRHHIPSCRRVGARRARAAGRAAAARKLRLRTGKPRIRARGTGEARGP